MPDYGPPVNWKPRKGQKNCGDSEPIVAPTPLLSRGVLSIDIPDLLLVRKPTTELSKWGLVPPAKRGGDIAEGAGGR